MAFEIAWNDRRPPIEVIPSMAVVDRAEFRFDVDNLGHVYLNVVYDPLLRRLAVETVNIVTFGPGTEITGAGLRFLRVQEFVQEAGMTMMRVKGHDGRWVDAEEHLFPSGRLEALAGDERVLVAAHLYTVARLLSQPPLKMVEDSLKVSHSTATRLMKRARDLGYLATVAPTRETTVHVMLNAAATVNSPTSKATAHTIAPKIFGFEQLPGRRLELEKWTVRSEITDAEVDQAFAVITAGDRSPADFR